MSVEHIKAFKKWCPITYKVADKISGEEDTYVYAPASIELARQAWNAAIEYARKPVSLEKAAIALWEPRNTHWTDAGKTAQAQYRRMAKAVLDAVGMSYDKSVR